MEPHRTLRSLTDSCDAAHISSTLAAIAPRCGLTASANRDHNQQVLAS